MNFSIDHNQVIFLDFMEDKDLPKFIDTCDAMLHARLSGETFGSAIAEFSAANKPVMTFSKSKDIEHIKILKDKALLYKNEKDLFMIIRDLPININKKNDWNAYFDYEPEKVMKDFERICLNKNKIGLHHKIYNFILDLPWEIIVFFINEILDPIRRLISRCIPKKLKDKKNNLKMLLSSKSYRKK